MASIPRKSIDHFTHPAHSLIPLDTTQDYLCDGCKTVGSSGKKYRCSHGCNFDLHEYCATCPPKLSSSMHPTHPLTLVMRKPQGTRQVHRICDVCRDPVDGLFYRCKECEFDVHPLCTQLPNSLHHALHKPHSLDLHSPGKPGFCAVCRNTCANWRYRCGVCNFDIHLECVLVPVVPCKESPEACERGIPRFNQGFPFQGHPNYGFPGNSFPYGPGNFYPMYNGHGYYNVNTGNFMAAPSYYQMGGVPAAGNNNGKKMSMFSLVGRLGFGVLSNMIFGVDLSSMFAG